MKASTNRNSLVAARTRLRGTFFGSSDTCLRGYALAVRLAPRLAAIGLSANRLTALALLLSALSGAAIATGHLGWAAALLAVSGLCDVLDGMVARSTNSASPFGALLDSVVDRFADLLPFAGLVVLVGDGSPRVLIPLLAIAASFSVSYLRARADSLQIALPALRMRRPERVIGLVLILTGAALAGGARLSLDVLLGGVLVLGAAAAASSLHGLFVAATLTAATPDGVPSLERPSIFPSPGAQPQISPPESFQSKA